MALTKAELVEMINSTITTNNKKEITAESLNLALNAIVEAMGTSTGSSGGANAELVKINPDGEPSDAMKEHNAMIYAKCKDAVDSGAPLPILQIDMSDFYSEMSGSQMYYIGNTTGIIAGYSDSQFMLMLIMDSNSFQLNSDGTYIMS